MATHPRIETSPQIMFGKPVIRGTRITVEQILRELGAGMKPEDVVREHPRLEVDDIYAAEAFAADFLASEEVILG